MLSSASATVVRPGGDRAFVTDGGLETDLIYRQGIDLPDFAAFPLLDTAAGAAALRRYFDEYAAIAASSGRALLLESPTWRANPDWGDRLGYPPAELDRLNRAAITLLADIRRRHLDAIGDILISGSIGPRYDGYSSTARLGADDAMAYHRPQIAAFAAAHADLATAYTITHVSEAVGIVRAAREAGLPIAVSFTVETDGRLPSGTRLADAIAEVDELAAPDYFLVNCAYPSHIEAALGEPGDWTARIAGTRANASSASHAELDEATELDDGDPAEFAAAHRQLMTRLPHLSILGGCCGTDSRHVAALMGIGIASGGAGAAG